MSCPIVEWANDVDWHYNWARQLRGIAIGKSESLGLNCISPERKTRSPNFNRSDWDSEARFAHDGNESWIKSHINFEWARDWDLHPERLNQRSWIAYITNEPKRSNWRRTDWLIVYEWQTTRPSRKNEISGSKIEAVNKNYMDADWNPMPEF